MADLAADYELLRQDVGAIWLDRDFVRVHGPDAASFLQGQCSQDLDPLTVGQATWSLLLQPQGKVDALVRILKTADDDFVLDVDSGYGEAVLARLKRFKLRVKAEIEPLDWRCLALRGPNAKGDSEEGQSWAVNASWPGLPGVDLVGPAPAVPAGVSIVGPDAAEAVRIEAGIPAMGRELTERTIPAEAGIVQRTVSFTKGCFTGQELVARIDSRGGHVARHLRGLVMSGAEPVPVGAKLETNGKQVGTVTSAADRPGGTIALAYVGRDVEPPADVTVAWEGGQAAARVEALPLAP
jgi:folate-binding protein YgfZ